MTSSLLQSIRGSEWIMAQYPQRIGEADCRDFLRTGRCKYGESCKYHHPANVQSGGGFKSLDPSEPPFPLRPNEPNCQYYLKHGTCKFGQTCKFHHPPHFMNKNQGNPQFQCAPVPGPDPAIGSEVIVLLPQRPNEPDCLYYLRNGRCKYGSTCKFHHPLSYQTVNMNVGSVHENVAMMQQQQQELSGRPSQSTFSHSQLQRGRSYSTNDVSIASNNNNHVLLNQHPQSHTHAGPTHILVPEGQIAVMLNPPVANKGSSSFHSSGTTSFMPPRSSQQGINSHSHAQPVSISSPIVSSSIASSYETTSSFELLAAPADNSTRWHRTSSQPQPQTQPNQSNSFGNSVSSHGSNRLGVPPRHAPGSQYYVMTRPGSNDMLYNNDLHQHQHQQSVSSTPIRHSQSNLLKFSSSSMEPTRDRRAVSLGSSADVTFFSSLDTHRPFPHSHSSLQHGWESNNSLSTLSTRFRDETVSANVRHGSSPQHTSASTSSFLINSDSTYDSNLYHHDSNTNTNININTHNNIQRSSLSEIYGHDDKPLFESHTSHPPHHNGGVLHDLHPTNIHPVPRKDSIDRLPDMVRPNLHSSRDFNGTLSFLENTSRSLEDDGLSTMTSALLNMLDTSEEMEGPGQMPNMDARKTMDTHHMRSSLPDGRSHVQRPMSGSTSIPPLTTSSERSGLSRLHYSSTNPNSNSKSNSNSMSQEYRSSLFSKENLTSLPFNLNTTNGKGQLKSQTVVAPQAASYL